METATCNDPSRNCHPPDGAAPAVSPERFGRSSRFQRYALLTLLLGLANLVLMIVFMGLFTLGSAVTGSASATFVATLGAIMIWIAASFLVGVQEVRIDSRGIVLYEYFGLERFSWEDLRGVEPGRVSVSRVGQEGLLLEFAGRRKAVFIPRSIQSFDRLAGILASQRDRHRGPGDPEEVRRLIRNRIRHARRRSLVWGSLSLVFAGVCGYVAVTDWRGFYFEEVLIPREGEILQAQVRNKTQRRALNVLELEIPSDYGRTVSRPSIAVTADAWNRIQAGDVIPVRALPGRTDRVYPAEDAVPRDWFHRFRMIPMAAGGLLSLVMAVFLLGGFDLETREGSLRIRRIHETVDQRVRMSWGLQEE